MARGTLQIVGDRPVTLQSELVLHQRSDQRTDTAQLRMTERILGSRFGHQLAVGSLQPLRHADAAIAELLHLGHAIRQGRQRALPTSASDHAA